MDAATSFYEQFCEMSKHFAMPARTYKSNMVETMMAERGLHPEIIVSLERSRESMARRLDTLIHKERGGFGIVFDEIGDFTADTWNKTPNLKLSQVGLAVKGQFK